MKMHNSNVDVQSHRYQGAAAFLTIGHLKPL